jgi:hypothetical protein
MQGWSPRRRGANRANGPTKAETCSRDTVTMPEGGFISFGKIYDGPAYSARIGACLSRVARTASYVTGRACKVRGKRLTPNEVVQLSHHIYGQIIPPVPPVGMAHPTKVEAWGRRPLCFVDAQETTAWVEMEKGLHLQ